MSKQRTPFGERLRTSREQAGLTQSALAHAVGVGLNTLNEWENSDRREPSSLAAVAAAARALGVREAWLAFGELPQRDEQRESA